MFKALTLGALCTAAFGLRMDSTIHNELTWADASNLSSKQKDWDNFFRKEIGALGDSAVKKVSGDNNFQYLDSTPGNGGDEVVAWEVNGGLKGTDWIVSKVTQVKTYTDKSDSNISFVEKTTYHSDNLPAITSSTFAWSSMDIILSYLI